MSTCPGRNYCDPSQSGCGDQNRGTTWFYTNQSRSCDCADPCISANSTTAQNYCNDNASNYGGGTFRSYCWEVGTQGICLCESNQICVRTGWDVNNKLGCCLGTLNDVANCDPSWCPQNLSTCTDVLATFCAQEQNVATNPVCVQFCSQDANKVYCDPGMQRYCTTHPNDPLCTCINATAIPRPSCFDVQCTETGYETQQMVRDATNCGAFCGEFIQCVQVNQCTINNPNFTEKCGNIPQPTPPGPQPTPPGPGPRPGPPTPPNPAFPTWIWLLVGGGLLLLVLIIAVVAFSRYRR